jgi:arginine/lysine/ornithine decarboxylase
LKIGKGGFNISVLLVSSGEFIIINRENTRSQIYGIIIIQFNSIYLCAKLNSPEANYKVSTGKKMRRVRRNR